MNPKLKNGFDDKTTGIQFIIPDKEQVPLAKAEKLFNEFVTNEREKLFRLWKSKPGNKEWKGDIESKKSELFSKKHPRGSEVILVPPAEK